MDDGGCEMVEPAKLHQIPEQFKDIPYQSVEVFICRLKPVDQDDEWTGLVLTLTCQ